MALIGMQGVSWGFGGTPLFEDINLQIEKGERVCLLGRNGLGKSTLLGIFTGEIVPDSGEVWKSPGIKISYLAQDVPAGQCDRVFDIVASGHGDLGQSIIGYRAATENPEYNSKTTAEEHVRLLQHELDEKGGWALLNRTEKLLSLAGLDPEADFSNLSAGMKRRVLFVRAVVSEPDLLLLDEPTNHLDMQSISWMEDFILQNIKTLVFVTHDRAFLKRIATRIVELDMGRVVSYSCDYSTYIQRRQAFYAAEEKSQAEFDKKLSAEEAWLRQGVKARRARNEGRVRALLKMRQQHRNRRRPVGNVNFQVDDSPQTGKMVIEARNITCTYGQKQIVSGFSTRIARGDRIGIIGPNGIGKSTLLNIFLKKTEPDTGEVRHGTGLMIASFDQLRKNLDENATVAQNIGDGNSYISVNGRKRHVIGYLKDFLFSPERSQTPVYILSGGEKNRLLLARLFARPANVLVLDEPTNDLDIETLELLEEMLFEFKGTVLLVSHDREFLNNVVTSTIVFEKPGYLVEYAGGYDDWLIQQKPAPEEKQVPKPQKKPKPSAKSGQKSKASQKLTFKEKQELEGLYEKIETLENKHEHLCASMADPEFYKKTSEEISEAKNRLSALEKEIHKAHKRWEVLEAINSKILKL